MSKKKRSKSHKFSTIYLIYSKDLDLFKVGVSFNAHKRKKQLQTGNAYYLVVKDEYKTMFPYKIETALHNHFNLYKKDDNKITLEGEWFALPHNVVDNFQSICQKIEKSLVFLLQSGNPFV